MAAMAARADHVAAVVALANSSSPVVASNSHTTSNRVSVRAPSGWRVQRDRERRWAASVKLVMGLTPSSSRKGNTTVMQAGNNNGVSNFDAPNSVFPPFAGFLLGLGICFEFCFGFVIPLFWEIFGVLGFLGVCRMEEIDGSIDGIRRECSIESEPVEKFG